MRMEMYKEKQKWTGDTQYSYFFMKGIVRPVWWIEAKSKKCWGLRFFSDPTPETFSEFFLRKMFCSSKWLVTNTKWRNHAILIFSIDLREKLGISWYLTKNLDCKSIEYLVILWQKFSKFHAVYFRDFVRGFRNRKQERRRRALEQQKAKQRLARQIARKEVLSFFYLQPDTWIWFR
jgi:hypothetical protein